MVRFLNLFTNSLADLFSYLRFQRASLASLSESVVEKSFLNFYSNTSQLGHELARNSSIVVVLQMRATSLFINDIIYATFFILVLARNYKAMDYRKAFRCLLSLLKFFGEFNFTSGCFPSIVMLAICISTGCSISDNGVGGVGLLVGGREK